MTIQEVSERCNIPMDILKEYDDTDLEDLERLNLIISLYNMGFEIPEVKSYIKLLGQKGTETQRMQMLNKKRYSILDQIHSREKQLEQLDYLRYRIRRQQEAKQTENAVTCISKSKKEG